jgi:hypothetical protein
MFNSNLSITVTKPDGTIVAELNAPKGITPNTSAPYVTPKSGY